ncbi:MAG: DUF4340 domain-containing protein [Gemmatimonadetes bacterium]|nr:DUF4340 domain-containing protein [Gemmatimonadota bacterium]
MSPKQLKVISGALAVLLLLWGASELFSRKSDKTLGERLFPPLALTDVDSIVIARKADTVRLVRPAGRGIWMVNGHLASALEMEGFFKVLADTARPEIAAENAASHQRMGVDSAGGRKVKVYGGGQVKLDVIVGERGPDYQSSYLRRPTEERVYLRLGPFAGFVDRGVDDWREHRMANLTVDSVGQVDVTRHGRRYSLVKKDGTWQFADGKPADSAAVARYLRNLSPLNATGFATPNEARSISFARPDLRLLVKDARGGTVLHLLGDSMPNGYWVRADSGGPIYRNGVWVADEMAPHDSTLRAKKP